MVGRTPTQSERLLARIDGLGWVIMQVLYAQSTITSCLEYFAHTCSMLLSGTSYFVARNLHGRRSLLPLKPSVSDVFTPSHRLHPDLTCDTWCCYPCVLESRYRFRARGDDIPGVELDDVEHTCISSKSIPYLLS